MRFFSFGSTKRLLLLAASVFCASLLPAYGAEPARGVSVDDWRGMSILNGGKGYVSTPMGQLHYRDIGPRDFKLPIVLLHQTPMSMIQFAGVQNALAEMGVRAIALDTPGYGLSDLPFEQPTIKGYADNIPFVLDQLGIEKAVIAGHHTGAEIAISFAANHAERTAGVILHGTALMTDEEAQSYLNMDRRPRTPLPDGSHLSRGFRFVQEGTSQEMLDARTWGVLTAYMQGPDQGHYAAYVYDALPDLKAIKAPGLLLTDLGDLIHEMDLRTAEVRPDFQYKVFSEGGSTVEFMIEPERWAEIAAEFISSLPK